ncbi:MAG: LamG-like jellyroll fold domain-containing protein [Bacteroidota bacterium]
MRNLLLIAFLGISLPLFAQTTVGLVAYYPLDSMLTDNRGNTANVGTPFGNIGYGCGVDDLSLRLDGFNSEVIFLGPVNQEFDTEDISISFYFKTTATAGTQYLLSKRDSSCINENVFTIRYVPTSRTINCTFTENANKGVSFTEQMSPDACWQHLAIVRDDTKFRLYINGRFRREGGTLSRLDLENNGLLTLGNALCKGVSESSFEGLIDELRIYNRALDDDEVAGLFFAPDQIINRDTNIFLGSSVPISLTTTCAQEFTWSPSNDVDSPIEPEPVITPSKDGPTVYTVLMTDFASGCTAKDSIRLNVVDPDDLDCAVVYLPRAFTPNGDNLNDTYGVSNPFAVQEFISFEIFDRWGNRVFQTASPFDKWDGSFQGQEVNSGVMLYKVRHICRGEELLTTGSFTVLR